ncbi:MAG: hypothetical protein H7336_09005 [Bacteriovorax sp.]|nr:hypothetical protein [Bacteriovorax sp.]
MMKLLQKMAVALNLKVKWPKKIVYDPASIESKFEPISTTAPSTATAIANNFNDMFSTSGFDTFAGKDKPKAEEVAAKPESVSDAPAAKGSSNDKMNEYLMKKLAAAEENLEKLKADNEAAEEDRVKQKKIDEETALIKDLKGQISDLKTQTAKNSAKKAADESVAAQEKAQIASRSNNFAGATIIGSRSPEASQVAVATESYDEGRSRASAIQAANARSIASSSGPVLNSVTNSDGSKTTTLGSGLVVTTVDGMTAEKAAITISNRIFELNGTPFYIEEGGVVKEIIAVVKDGKVLLDEKGNPIFEKIVKGKVGDKKFAKNKDKDRAPASITDAADLKRDQEEKLKRERAEYLKLKNLTNEALKRK